jgi:prepilin-type processing-associated H-X9-DG protein
VGADAPSLPAGDGHAGIFSYDRRSAFAKDGAFSTLLMLESARDNGPWAQGGPGTVRGLDPADQPYLGTGRPFGGTHFAENTLFEHGRSIGCNAAMVDGSVRFLRETIDPQVLEALATIAGGKLSDDW